MRLNALSQKNKGDKYWYCQDDSLFSTPMSHMLVNKEFNEIVCVFFYCSQLSLEVFGPKFFT